MTDTTATDYGMWIDGDYTIHDVVLTAPPHEILRARCGQTMYEDCEPVPPGWWANFQELTCRDCLARLRSVAQEDAGRELDDAELMDWLDAGVELVAEQNAARLSNRPPAPRWMDRDYVAEMEARAWQAD